MAEKRFKATPRRLRDARRQGEVAMSHDVSAALAFVVVLAVLWAVVPHVLRLMRDLWQHATEPGLLAAPQQRGGELLVHAAEVLLWSTLPIAVAAAVAAAAGCFVQVGGLMAWVRLRPDASRLNPAEGLKRIFSTYSLVHLLKMVVKTTLLGLLLAAAIRSALDTALKLGFASPAAAMQAGGQVLLVVLAWAAVIYVAMAVFDLVHVRYEYLRRQRMSIDDLRREHRETDGDPTHASRRRAAHREAIYLGLADRVRAASVLIASGRTAVALVYLGEHDLPRVLARGANDVAAQMRRFAADAGVPVEFDTQLAGRLYDDTTEGLPIARALYEPVATVLRRLRHAADAR